jgi:hypothetical protein
MCEPFHRVLGAQLLPADGDASMDVASLRVLIREYEQEHAGRVLAEQIAGQRLQMLGHGQTQLDAARTATTSLLGDLVDTYRALVAVLDVNANPDVFVDAAAVARRVGRILGEG